MKKRSILIASTLSLLLGITSCSKEGIEVGSDSADAGKLSITFSLPSGSANSRAMAASTAKPLTNWNSISRAMILFVDPLTNIIKDAREVMLPTSGGTGSGNMTNTYVGLVANATGYTAFIIGNYPATWSTSTVKGTNYSALVFAVPTAPTYTVGNAHYDTGAAGYGEINDLFIAKQTGVIVNADANNVHPVAFALTRSNSLFRVRIDVMTKNTTTRNSAINFTDAATMFSIRRAATSYLLSGSTNYSSSAGVLTAPGSYFFANTENKALNVFYKVDAMKDINPTTATHSNPETILTHLITLWNEYNIYPGGSNATTVGSGKDKFDIVLSALTADAAYVPTGHTAPVPAGTRIYWSGQVQNAVGPNQILELNIVLENAGTTTLPEVGEYGNIEIQVSLVQWGEIISSELPM